MANAGLALLRDPRQTRCADDGEDNNPMRMANWTRLSWWQKTQVAVFCVLAIAIILAIALIIVIGVFADSQRLSSLAWLAFTAFPFLVVTLVAGLARLQQNINLHSRQTNDFTSGREPTFR